jgi:hypothetical protein
MILKYSFKQEICVQLFRYILTSILLFILEIARAPHWFGSLTDPVDIFDLQTVILIALS